MSEKRKKPSVTRRTLHHYWQVTKPQMPLFVADVTEARVFNNVPSVTYAYYFDHIKPKPQKPAEKKVGWVCKICGYVYEGEELPADFVCPLCKHGAADFEKLK